MISDHLKNDLRSSKKSSEMIPEGAAQAAKPSQMNRGRATPVT
jgi:hypothetical protein